MMMAMARFGSLSRIVALPAMVRAQLVATSLNSASVMVKLFLPLLFRSAYALEFATIGILMAAYGAGCVAGAYIGGASMRRVDPRRLTAACLCMSGLLAIGLAQLPSVGWLFVVVPAIGAADGAFRPANLRLVMEAGSPNEATWLQGLHRISFNFGVALAGAAAAALTGAGYPFLFAAAGVVGVVGGCLLMQHMRDSASTATAATLPVRRGATEGAAGDVRSPWSDRPFLLFVLGQLLALGIFDQMYGTLGLFLAKDYRFDRGWIGYLFSLNALLIVLVQAPAMTLIARIGVVAASRWGTLLLIVAFPLLNVGEGPAYAIGTMVLVTGAEILLTPAWTLVVMERSANRDRGRYLGVFSAAWLGHSLYGPACGTWIYGAMGGAGLWWICAGAGLAVGGLHWHTVPALSAPVRQ